MTLALLNQRIVFYDFLPTYPHKIVRRLIHNFILQKFGLQICEGRIEENLTMPAIFWSIDHWKAIRTVLRQHLRSLPLIVIRIVS